MDHVTNDMRVMVDECYVLAYRDVLVILRRRRQVASEIAGNAVAALLQFAIERLTGLNPAFLFRRQPVGGAQAPRSILLMLVVPVLSGLPVVLAELLVRTVVVLIPMSLWIVPILSDGGT